MLCARGDYAGAIQKAKNTIFFAAGGGKKVFKQGLCNKFHDFLLPAGVAKNYFEHASFFMILQSKIMKNEACSKFSFTAEGGGILFTNPHLQESLL